MSRRCILGPVFCPTVRPSSFNPLAGPRQQSGPSAADTPAHRTSRTQHCSLHTGNITNPAFFSHPVLIHLSQSAPIPHCSVKVCRGCLGPFFGSCVQQVWAGRVAGPVWVCSLDVGFEPRQRSTTDWAPASLFASINK